MLISVIFFIIGLAILIKGSDFLVDGASSIAAKLSIAPIVIGLTIVSFGTSAPELLVSLTSASKGNTDIAFGNVVGSNIFNILVILGITSLIYPIKVQKNTAWKEIPMSFLGAILLVVLGYSAIIDSQILNLGLLQNNDIVGSISRSNGFTLLLFFIIFLYYTFGIAKAETDEDIEIKSQTLPKSILWITLGLIGLTIGSQVTIDNAVSIARALHISDTLIGLTLVSMGTSFPELFTNIAAARKKNTDIAVGNIVGSNIFNIFLILGLTSTIHEIPIRGTQGTDILVLLATTILLFTTLFIWRKHVISRKEGLLMLSAYLLYSIYIFYRG